MARIPGKRSLMVIGMVAAGTVLLQASAVLAAGSSVTINNYQYTPKSIAVKPGATITWTNKQADDNHTVTADNGSFDTGVINKAGGTASLTFNTAGTFTYHCKIHSTMHGTVVVSASAVEPPATDATDFATSLGGGSLPLPLLFLVSGLALLLIAGSLALRRRTEERAR